MKKLHIKIDGEWEMVFCYMHGTNEIITTSNPIKALAVLANCGDRDLEFFKNKFGNDEFALMEPKKNLKLSSNNSIFVLE